MKVPRNDFAASRLARRRLERSLHRPPPSRSSAKLACGPMIPQARCARSTTGCTMASSDRSPLRPVKRAILESFLALHSKTNSAAGKSISSVRGRLLNCLTVPRPGAGRIGHTNSGAGLLPRNLAKHFRRVRAVDTWTTLHGLLWC